MKDKKKKKIYTERELNSTIDKKIHQLYAGGDKPALSKHNSENVTKTSMSFIFLPQIT